MATPCGVPKRAVSGLSDYTREAGVRQLERELGTILRKTATIIVGGHHEKPVPIDAAAVVAALGRPKVHHEAAARVGVPGVARGLAVTGVGGDVLFVEAAVLPDLERVYSRIRAWTHASFDPAAVARAELAWRVARRIPGESNAENVGRLIAGENALIFGVPVERVLEPSLLRARAGALRDMGAEHADWATISRLLHDAHRGLYRAANASTP